MAAVRARSSQELAPRFGVDGDEALALRSWYD